MRWTLWVWDGQLPLRGIYSENTPWEMIQADTVQRVDIYLAGHKMILSGHDHYWIHNTQFGVYNDDSGEYVGSPGAAYEWGGGRCIQLDDFTPPPGANILHGCYMPNDQAEKAGIL